MPPPPGNRPSNAYTEEQLIALLRQGGREGFNYLYENYSPALFGIILKVLPDEGAAQDVLQEVFVKVWNSIARYDSSKGRLYTWMLNIARNAAIDKLRSRGEIMKGKIHGDEFVVNNLHSQGNQGRTTDAIGLNNLVAGLKPEFSSLINMAYFRGYTLEEISKELSIPLGTVKTRMRSAMQQLRGFFKQ